MYTEMHLNLMQRPRNWLLCTNYIILNIKIVHSGLNKNVETLNS